MQYISSVQIRVPTFVSCNNCKLWFPVDSDHYCNKNIDTVFDIVYATGDLQ